MLVIWRAVGQSVRIGGGVLTVEAVRPRVQLRYTDASHDQQFSLRRSRGGRIIPAGCRVVVLDSSLTEVRLGLDAPDDVHITRTELMPPDEEGPVD